MIYKRIGLCDSVRKLGNGLYDELNDLLKRHPDYNEKTKSMTDIKIKQNKTNTKAFETRIISDNTDEAISWKYAVNGKKKDNDQNLSAAMRTSIRFYILNFKSRNEHICSQCRSEKDPHVDHIIHFKKLKKDFLKKCNTDSIKIPKNFSQLNDGSNLTCFLKEDNYFEKLWFEYHAKFAKLRILCKECNLQRNKY